MTRNATEKLWGRLAACAGLAVATNECGTQRLLDCRSRAGCNSAPQIRGRSSESQAGVTLIELLIVVMIVAVIAGISFPALTSGLSSVRLSSASGTAASFLTSAMNRVERTETAAAIVITPRENRIAMFTAASGGSPEKTLKLPQGISIEGDEPRRFLLQPGGAFPRIALILRSDKGLRRSVKIDPATGVPDIQRVAEK